MWAQELWKRQSALRIEIEMRYGPGAPSRLPVGRGFGARKKADDAAIDSDDGVTVKAAGILFLTPDRKVLLLKRGPGGDHPGEWCFPGGTTEGDETPEQTAVREAVEECGEIPKGSRTVLARAITPLITASVEMPAGAAPEPISGIALQSRALFRQ